MLVIAKLSSKNLFFSRFGITEQIRTSLLLLLHCNQLGKPKSSTPVFLVWFRRGGDGWGSLFPEGNGLYLDIYSYHDRCPLVEGNGLYLGIYSYHDRCPLVGCVWKTKLWQESFLIQVLLQETVISGHVNSEFCYDFTYPEKLFCKKHFLRMCKNGRIQLLSITIFYMTYVCKTSRSWSTGSTTDLCLVWTV